MAGTTVSPSPCVPTLHLLWGDCHPSDHLTAEGPWAPSSSQGTCDLTPPLQLPGTTLSPPSPWPSTVAATLRWQARATWQRDSESTHVSHSPKPAKDRREPGSRGLFPHRALLAKVKERTARATPPGDQTPGGLPAAHRSWAQAGRRVALRPRDLTDTSSPRGPTLMLGERGSFLHRRLREEGDREMPPRAHFDPGAACTAPPPTWERGDHPGGAAGQGAGAAQGDTPSRGGGWDSPLAAAASPAARPAAAAAPR